MQQFPAQREHLPLSLIKVSDLDIQMKLLWIPRIRPPRSPIVGDPLKSEHQPTPQMQRRETPAHRPPRIPPIHLPTHQPLIEPRQPHSIRTVQNNTLQLTNHPPNPTHPHPPTSPVPQKTTPANVRQGGRT